MIHNSTSQTAWEREAADPSDPQPLLAYAYSVGINIMMYAMTH